jgi:hypothetical protein
MTMKRALAGILGWGVISILAAAHGDEEGVHVAMSAATYAGGVLQPNEVRAERKLPVGSSRDLTIVVTSTANLTPSLQLPDGSKASPGDGRNDRIRWYSFLGGDGASQMSLPGAGSGFNTLVTFQAPPPGLYVVRLDRPRASIEPVPFFITLTEDSDLRMGLVTPYPDAVIGGAFVVAAVLVDQQGAVRDADVTATLTRTPDDSKAVPIPVRKLALTDDGQGADARRGDGVYSGIVAPTAPGTHWIAVRARGKSLEGNPFERHAGTSFRASEPTVQVKVGPSQWLRKERSRRIASLAVPVQLEGPRGTYQVVVTLRASNGRRIGGVERVDIGPEERARVNVQVEAERVRLLDAEGPYRLESTEVYEMAREDRVLRARRAGTDETPPLERGSLDVR